MPAPSSKGCILLVTLVLLWYNGVDVAPGSLDEAVPAPGHVATDFSITDIFEGRDPLVRLQRSNGLAVSEEDEAKLLPLLEDLEAGIEALELKAEERSFLQKKQLKMIDSTRKALKNLEILSDTHIDGLLTKRDIANVIEQMGATVSWRRHFFRFSLAVLFLMAPDAGGGFQRALFIEFFLIFMPYGWNAVKFSFNIMNSIMYDVTTHERRHPVTTAGRHFEGERTWHGLRRIDYGLFLLLQGALVFFANQAFNTKGNKGKPAGIFLRCLDSIYSLASVAFFGWVGHSMYSAAPNGWMLYGGGAEECAAEFTMAVAAQMHICYLGFLVVGVADAVLDQVKSGRNPWSTLSRGKQDHWFWFLVMYFGPYEDAAVPMMMACARQVAAALTNVVGLQSLNDHFITPSTTIVELTHFLVTVMSGCHWPLVLWVRVPALFEGLLAFAQNCRYFVDGAIGGSGGWVTGSAKLTKVTIFYPVHRLTPQSERLSGKPGSWVRQSVEVLLEPEPMSLGLNPAGAMRDVYHMLDPNGSILSHPSVANALTGLNISDKRKLVYKKYRNTDDEYTKTVNAIWGKNGIYFSDVYMQHQAAGLAEIWNANAPAGAAEMVYAPAFVMEVGGGGSSGASQVFGVECFLDGAYMKWNNNGAFPETFAGSDDDAPTAFCHFTHDATGGEMLVCDIQGVKKSNTTVSSTGVNPSRKDMHGKRFVLTDPQIHTKGGGASSNSDFGLGNMGSKGIDDFFKGHRCRACCNTLNLKHTKSTATQNLIDASTGSSIQKFRHILLGLIVLIVAIWVACTFMNVTAISADTDHGHARNEL